MFETVPARLKDWFNCCQSTTGVAIVGVLEMIDGVLVIIFGILMGNWYDSLWLWLLVHGILKLSFGGGAIAGSKYMDYRYLLPLIILSTIESVGMLITCIILILASQRVILWDDLVQQFAGALKKEETTKQENSVGFTIATAISTVYLIFYIINTQILILSARTFYKMRPSKPAPVSPCAKEEYRYSTTPRYSLCSPVTKMRISAAKDKSISVSSRQISVPNSHGKDNSPKKSALKKRPKAKGPKQRTVWTKVQKGKTQVTVKSKPRRSHGEKHITDTIKQSTRSDSSKENPWMLSDHETTTSQRLSSNMSSITSMDSTVASEYSPGSVTTQQSGYTNSAYSGKSKH